MNLDLEGRELLETTLKLIPVLTAGIKSANNFRSIPVQGDKARILDLVHNDSPELKSEEIMAIQCYSVVIRQ